MKGIVLAALILLLLFPIAYAQVVPDTVGTEVAIEATPTSGPTLLDKISTLIAALAPILTFLVGTGALSKYLPFMAWLPNQLIGWLNTAIAFVALFVISPPQAHAGIFGDFVHALSFPVKAAASVVVAAGARELYELLGRGLFLWIEKKTGLHPAGLTKAEVDARKASL